MLIREERIPCRIARDILDTVDRGTNFLVTSHVRGDGDSYGSQLALRAFLLSMGKNCRVINSTPVPESYKFLQGASEIETASIITGSFDATFVLDSPCLPRLGFDSLDIPSMGTLINIDHHLGNSRFADYMLVDTSISSTCELIYELLNCWSWKGDSEVGLCMYTGLMTDTGNLCFKSVSARTFQIAYELVASGVDHYRLYNDVYRASSRRRLALMGEMLRDFSVSDDLRVGWFVFGRELLDRHGATGSEVHGLISQMMTMKSLDLAAVFVQDGEDTVLEFRSSEAYDASRIANHFGGGGHRNASGSCLRGDALEVAGEVMGHVLVSLEKYAITGGGGIFQAAAC
ncbi:MAG: hypothetical protein CVV64_01725 [Candidatus Wallbacteria bacterium HGW-Wallbacteria-1]|jgi:phosphoesterase RecJ-like protein|uniref:DDH domain-containing protein n=1 Tax=Candidatus Wallbacteria bacterium HGW-Wallbacteria-1 TaxID=2013854 RepID=A0A2N1PUZ9_9BACT|nr:MAG: hypothetical protein CVV64_01725 [Candidatus Wallbacteria bacterium HGW-Wallbacteria-1]